MPACAFLSVCVFMCGEGDADVLLYITNTCPTVCSTYECLMTLSLTCCSTWWPRSGSWICPSCSSQSTGACRTLNYSPNSSRSLAKGSSRLPWQPERGSSLEGSTQVQCAVQYILYMQLIFNTNIKSLKSDTFLWMLMFFMCNVKMFHGMFHQHRRALIFYTNWVAIDLCLEHDKCAKIILSYLLLNYHLTSPIRL